MAANEEDWNESSGRYELVRAETSGVHDIGRIRTKRPEVQLVETLLGQLEAETTRRITALESQLKDLDQSCRSSDDFARQAMLGLVNQVGRNTRELRALADAVQAQNQLLRTLVDRFNGPHRKLSDPPAAPITADLNLFDVVDEREG